MGRACNTYGERRGAYRFLMGKPEAGRACNTYGERRGVYRVLMGKPEGRRSLGRPRRRWEDNIKTYL